METWPPWLSTSYSVCARRTRRSRLDLVFSNTKAVVYVIHVGAIALTFSLTHDDSPHSQTMYGQHVRFHCHDKKGMTIIKTFTSFATFRWRFRLNVLLVQYMNGACKQLYGGFSFRSYVRRRLDNERQLRRVDGRSITELVLSAPSSPRLQH